MWISRFLRHLSGMTLKRLTPHMSDEGPRLITSANRGASDESHSQLALSLGAAVETVTRTEHQGDLIESKWL